MTCALTRAMSEPKERGDARLLAVIGFPHAEDMAIRATRRVANHYQTLAEEAEADEAPLASTPCECPRPQNTGPAKTSAASSKSSPRSASAPALFFGSYVIATGLVYVRKLGEARGWRERAFAASAERKGFSRPGAAAKAVFVNEYRDCAQCYCLKKKITAFIFPA